MARLGATGQKKLTQATRYMDGQCWPAPVDGSPTVFVQGCTNALLGTTGTNIILSITSTCRGPDVVLTRTAGIGRRQWSAKRSPRGHRSGAGSMPDLRQRRVDVCRPPSRTPGRSGDFKFGVIIAVILVAARGHRCSWSWVSGAPFPVRQTGRRRRMYGGQSTYIPLKVNQAASSRSSSPARCCPVRPAVPHHPQRVVPSIVPTGTLSYAAPPRHISMYGLRSSPSPTSTLDLFDPHQQADLIRNSGGYFPG